MSVLCLVCYMFFFFKQKTAYEMRISDWSSDVCSSDLHAAPCAHLPDRCDQLGVKHVILARGREASARGARPVGGQVEHRHSAGKARQPVEIGRASCRERGCQYV